MPVWTRSHNDIAAYAVIRRPRSFMRNLYCQEVKLVKEEMGVNRVGIRIIAHKLDSVSLQMILSTSEKTSPPISVATTDQIR